MGNNNWIQGFFFNSSQLMLNYNGYKIHYLMQDTYEKERKTVHSEARTFE